MLKRPDTYKPCFRLDPEARFRILHYRCVTCPNDIKESNFRDELSMSEYTISGMCQECQDKAFPLQEQ